MVARSYARLRLILANTHTTVNTHLYGEQVLPREVGIGSSGVLRCHCYCKGVFESFHGLGDQINAHTDGGCGNRYQRHLPWYASVCNNILLSVCVCVYLCACVCTTHHFLVAVKGIQQVSEPCHQLRSGFGRLYTNTHNARRTLAFIASPSDTHARTRAPDTVAT